MKCPINEMKTLKIIGYGNMASAMLNGILNSKLYDNIEILGRNPYKIIDHLNDLKCKKLNYDSYAFNEIKINIQKTNVVKLLNEDILLACKKDNLENFDFIGNAKIIYSVLANASCDDILRHLNGDIIALLMPNIGASKCLSATTVFFDCDKVQVKEEIKQFVESFGNCVFVDSFKQLNASIATSGSSPAILALVAQSLINAGIHEGLNLTQSTKLVQKTFEGVAELLKYNSPQELKDKITSPSGTTTEALLYCDLHSVQGNITQACIEAVSKTKN